MADQVVLLVEDNEADVKLTRRAFAKAGFAARLDVVADGVEALDYLHGSDGNPPGPLPDVVLLDLNLPRLSGHDVLERIRAAERTRRLPVVVLTSSVEEGDVAKSYDRGANSYVRKPVAFDAFIEATRYMGTYWLKINHRPPGSGAAT